jgi:hypothetical protein
MKDIIGAMAKEREYLSFRMKGEEPYHFVDAVKEFGFESLREYFDARFDHVFEKHKQEIINSTPDWDESMGLEDRRRVTREWLQKKSI